MPWSRYWRAMSRISPRLAPTHVRCGAPVRGVSRWMRVTSWWVRVRVEPSAPYVTETKHGASGARRSTERHSVASISTSAGGKNSKETFMFALALRRADRAARPLRGQDRHRGQDVLAIGFDGTHALAGEAGLAEEPAQPRERVLHHAITRALERVIALEEEQPPIGRERVPARGEQRAQCLIGRVEPVEDHSREGATEAREIPRPQRTTPRGEEDAATKASALSRRARDLGGSAGVSQDGALRPHAGRGLDQLRMVGSDEQHRAGRGDGLGRFHEAAQLSAQARCRWCTRMQPLIPLRSRPLAVASEQRIGTIELPEQTLYEAGGRSAPCQGVVHPLTMPQPLDQTCLAQDLEMARYARLALADDLRDIGDAEIARGAKREQA